MTVLSEVPGNLPRVWHPWRTLRSRPNITLRWERMRQWCELTRTITLHPDQNQRERRSTLAHELRHAEAAHRGHCAPAVERRVCERAARDLIGIEALADALVWSQDEWEVAEELWVDVETARARIESLTPPEKDYIERRVAAREGTP